MAVAAIESVLRRDRTIIARRLLHRLLLGADGIAVHRRSDERAVDRRDRDTGAGREGGSRGPCDSALEIPDKLLALADEVIE
jgi:hypothetical protein